MGYLDNSDREALKYFVLVSCALFLPYLAYQKCTPTANTTGAGTYNYLTQVAPPAATAAATEIRLEIHVGLMQNLSDKTKYFIVSLYIHTFRGCQISIMTFSFRGHIHLGSTS